MPNYIVATSQLRAFLGYVKALSPPRKASQVILICLQWWSKLIWLSVLKGSLSPSGHTASRKADRTDSRTSLELHHHRKPSSIHQYSHSQIHSDMAFSCHLCSFASGDTPVRYIWHRLKEFSLVCISSQRIVLKKCTVMSRSEQYLLTCHRLPKTQGTMRYLLLQ